MLGVLPNNNDIKASSLAALKHHISLTLIQHFFNHQSHAESMSFMLFKTNVESPLLLCLPYIEIVLISIGFSWYNVEKASMFSELKDVAKLAITSDGWTSLCQDHYLTVTVHYTRQGSVKQKVTHTRAVYQSQTVK